METANNTNETPLEDSSPTIEKICDSDFPWHLRAGLIVAIIATVVACIAIFRGDTGDDLKKVASATLWTTYAVGNPHTVAMANLRKSVYSENILCGRINYEQSNNRGWSGYTDFFIEKGVMYIAPPTGTYAKAFAEYCLVPVREAPST